MVTDSTEYKFDVLLKRAATAGFGGLDYDHTQEFKEDQQFRQQVATLILAADYDEDKDELGQLYEEREVLLHVRRTESMARASYIQRGVFKNETTLSDDSEELEVEDSDDSA